MTLPTSPSRPPTSSTDSERALRRFQKLLEELFRFDCADLDFGIYRILNHKRDAIREFIHDELPTTVRKALAEGDLASQGAARAELDETRQQVLTTLGADAIAADGTLTDAYRGTPLGQKYLTAREKSRGTPPVGALAADVYNHLHALFSRYYQDGDFLSKRRYSKNNRYAIPYNGEEVYMHWANSDQYYVKTTEHFRDYEFRTPDGTRVSFELRDADVEHDNVRGAERYFFAYADDSVWSRESRRYTIPFEYRPLTAEENRSFGKKRKKQDYLNARACAAILNQTRFEPPLYRALVHTAPRSMTRGGGGGGGGSEHSLLRYRLNQYTHRHTSDFFIHKDLDGFLNRELDFYLKNEVLDLDTATAGATALPSDSLPLLRTLRALGGSIITFLAQIENFQKRLWEKRKFVLDTHYLVSASLIPTELLPTVLACEPQWREWHELGLCVPRGEARFSAGQDSASRRRFLSSHDGILLDTRHFDPAFTDALLDSLDDLNAFSAGLCVHSENWQALSLLEERYREALSCAYIDPPYNTAASAILYKNDYKDSSWLSLMADRLSSSRKLLTSSGILSCAIDDEEVSRLRMLMQDLFPKELGTVVVRSNPAGRKSRGQLSPSHEFALFFGNLAASPGSLRKTDLELARYRFEDEIGRYDWNNLIRHGSNDRREDRPKLFFPIYVGEDHRIRVPQLQWVAEERRYDVLEDPRDGEVEVLPVRTYGDEVVEKNWHHGPKKIMTNPGQYRVRRRGSAIDIDFIIRMDTKAIPKTWWGDARYASSNHGARAIKDLFGSKPFDYAKALGLVEDCLRVCGLDTSSTVLDYFAGSGTTGHSVINLNRDDAGRRKFILVEMGDHFDTVLLPRLKKVAFSPAWKDGRAQRPATPEEAKRGPRIIKYFRMESYEDSLNNIEFEEPDAGLFRFEDYMLRYMLQWETKESATLLRVEKLERPFEYTLSIHRDGRTRNRQVDLPETFNFLIGLLVRTRRVYQRDGRRVLVLRGRTTKGRETVVIWRDIAGWDEAEFDAEREWVAEQGLAEGVETIWVNADSAIEGAESLDPMFKRLMFAPMPS